MFNVGYSKTKDIDNYLNSLWKFKYLKHGRVHIADELGNQFPGDFINSLKLSKNRVEANRVVVKFIDSQHPFLWEYIGRMGKHLQTALNEEEDGIKAKLESLYQEKFPFTEIGVYITTLKICPYDYKHKWFMVTVYGDKTNHVKTVLHELNHFMFYYYYGDLEESLGREKFESLKEALTVFTNVDEEGYPNQRKLRKWLSHQPNSIPAIIRQGEWRTYL